MNYGTTQGKVMSHIGREEDLHEPRWNDVQHMLLSKNTKQKQSVKHYIEYATFHVRKTF